MAKQIAVEKSAVSDTQNDQGISEIVPDVGYQRLAIVNVVYVGARSGGDAGLQQPWVLIDAGVSGSKSVILKSAEHRFGDNARPAAILMTHGHFDHVGALVELAEHWDVPIYAHKMESPYLNGTRSYLPPDSSVGGGLMSAVADLYPRGPVDVSRWLVTLPEDGSVPGMRGWKWIATPGHTPGHVSFWRESDRLLIAGDAFITTAQESAYAVLMQRPELHGPPMYYTPDWAQAETSVNQLARLEPEYVITGHGPPLQGEEMRRSLRELAARFRQVAVPDHGKYVDTPQPAD